MISRPDAEEVITSSDLDGICRELLLVLWITADPRTGFIEPRDGPSLNRLAWLSGWHKATVVRHLAHLAAGRWITRKVPSVADQRRHHARTSYELHIPAGARRTPPPGLVAESDSLGAHGDRLGAESDQARRGERPELGAGSDRLGAGSDTLSTDRQTSTARGPARDLWDDDDLIKIAKEELEAAAPGRAITIEQARAAVRDITQGQVVRKPVRYVRAAIGKTPGKFLPAPDIMPPAQMCGRCGGRHAREDCPL